MKNQLFALALLLTFSTAVLARNPIKTSVTTRIADDGSRLMIQIDRHKNDHNTHYQNSFDVSGMNFVQKDWLKYRVFAEQDVTLPFHEMRGLVFAVVGLIAFLSTLLVFGYRHRKSSPINS